MRGLRSGHPGRRAHGSPGSVSHRVAVGVGVLVLAAGVVAGCGTTTAGARTPPPGFESCTGVTGGAGFCGSLQVPLDWADPTGPTTALWVTLIPATVSPAPDALFFLAGGPGADAEQDIPWLTRAFARVNEHHDLVVVDQRGTGRSDFEGCPGLGEGQTPSALRLAVQLCLSTVSTDASYFTTESAAHDLDHVRALLGYDTIDLYGVSYGVSLGLAYLQAYGDHVRSAVLDSGSLLDTPLWQEAPLHAQEAFDLLVRRCAASPSCARSDDPAGDLQDVLAQVRGSSGAVDGVLNAIDDDYLGKSTAAVLLPGDLHLAAQRGLTALARKRKSWFASSSSSPPLMSLTIECGDAWAAIDPGAVGDSTFAPMMVARSEYLATLCPIWPHQAGVSGSVHSSAPVLFLNGTADPTDPPANVAGATRTMPNALVVAVPGSAHWVLNASWNWGVRTPACLVDGVATFIDAGRPASRRAWDACTTSIAKDVPGFPATG